MSLINFTNQPTLNTVSMVVRWANLANGDTGNPMPFSQYTDKSVQVVGTFGAGGSVSLQGSNDGTNWSVLTDPQGNALDFTSSRIEMVTEAALYVRPAVS